MQDVAEAFDMSKYYIVKWRVLPEGLTSHFYVGIQINSKNKPATFMALISFRMALRNKSFFDAVLKARLKPVQEICFLLETRFSPCTPQMKSTAFFTPFFAWGIFLIFWISTNILFLFFYFCTLLISSVHKRVDSDVTLHGSEEFAFSVF